jgi:hypothetical protein
MPGRKCAMILLVIGLALIIVGWLVQVYKTTVKKDKTLNSLFLIPYAIGVGFLVVGNFLLNNATIAILNLVSFLVALTLTITVLFMGKAE